MALLIGFCHKVGFGVDVYWGGLDARVVLFPTRVATKFAASSVDQLFLVKARNTATKSSSGLLELVLA